EKEDHRVLDQIEQESAHVKQWRNLSRAILAQGIQRAQPERRQDESRRDNQRDDGGQQREHKEFLVLGQHTGAGLDQPPTARKTLEHGTPPSRKVKRR